MDAAGTAAALLLVAVLGGCVREVVEEPEDTPEGEIVRVGDAVLTETDLLNLLPESERIPFTLDERRAFVQRWVDTEILHQEALRRGLREDPRVKTRLECFEQEYLADQLLFLELRDRTVVTDDEVERYFDEHRDEYLYEYRVSHILVSTRQEAEDIVEMLGSRSFAWVADRYSIDSEAKRGGDLGYLTKGNMIPEFESVVFDMETGGVSGIVKSDFGYHVIKLVGTREALVKVSLDDVRVQIMNTLTIRKRERAYSDFMELLRVRARMVYTDTRYAPGSPSEAGDTLGLWEEDSLWADEEE